ncbi:MAG TPA: ABC transporter permease, partial [Gammaproteobacteria bacterium]|nr:ABC transporter permease [Gammaproteobacteria bacterium]
MASFGWKALRGYPARTVLMLAAMAVGVSAVVVLTSLGEGARRYVTGEFAALGTNLLIVIPGRSETAGISPTTLMGETPRPLTLQDARALLRSHEVRRVAPLNIGSVEVSRRGRSRDVLLVGSSAQLLPLRHWKMAEGRFLPDVELERSIPVAVIGRKIRDELFGARPAVGEWLRIGERRFRVIGILATTGRSIDIKVEETVIVPVAAAQQLLNTSSLFRILVEAGNRGAVGPLRQFIVETLQKRHQGARDVTVVTQDAVLATFDRVFGALTLAVGGIAAISLA